MFSDYKRHLVDSQPILLHSVHTMHSGEQARPSSGQVSFTQPRPGSQYEKKKMKQKLPPDLFLLFVNKHSNDTSEAFNLGDHKAVGNAN